MNPVLPCVSMVTYNFHCRKIQIDFISLPKQHISKKGAWKGLRHRYSCLLIVMLIDVHSMSESKGSVQSIRVAKR
jgi:hypothetical protein